MPDHRLQQLQEPHVRPLTDDIAAIRRRGLIVPDVDPKDGGILARALFLLETPGPKAVVSGFVSRDNKDFTASNMGESLDQAGFARKEVVLWNVVPHCLSTKDANRNATVSDIRDAVPDTQAFIDRLPNLKVIVFCGNSAQRAVRYLRFPSGVNVLRTFHTGAQAYNHSSRRQHIHGTFREAATLAR